MPHEYLSEDQLARYGRFPELERLRTRGTGPALTPSDPHPVRV